MSKCNWKEMAEQRRPKSDTRDHFADNVWLADPPEDPARQVSQKQDSSNGDDYVSNLHENWPFNQLNSNNRAAGPQGRGSAHRTA